MNFRFIGKYYIQADQIQSINPILIMILIPTFNWIIYPAFEKRNLLKKPIQRMTIGMLFACVAFLASALLENKIQNEFMKKNSSPNTVQLLNLSPFDVQVNTSDLQATFKPSNQLRYTNSGSNSNKSFTIQYNNSSFNYNFDCSNHTFTPENVSGFGCRCGCKHPHPHPHPITQKNWVFEFQNDFKMKKNTNFELKKNFRKIQKFR